MCPVSQAAVYRTSAKNRTQLLRFKFLTILMKYLILILLVATAACKLSNTNPTKEPNKEIAVLFDRYYDERLKLYPLEATVIGDERFNDLLQIDFTNSYQLQNGCRGNRFRSRGYVKRGSIRNGLLFVGIGKAHVSFIHGLPILNNQYTARKLVTGQKSIQVTGK